MIVLTGANGRLGRAIAEALLGQIPAAEVGLSARDPEKAADLAARGARVRRGDFTDPEGLTRAFEGARTVLLVSSNARAVGGDPLAQHRAAIDAARAAGAARILYTSHMAASPTSAFPPMLDHAATERMLESCGVPWTSLRNGFYPATVMALAEEAAKRGVIAAPRDGKVAWTTHADLAAAAAALALADDPPEGPTPPLTAAEALDLDDVARLLSERLGRPIRREVVDDERFAAALAERGTPPAYAEIAVGLYRASRAGEFAAVDPTLERLIGRRPISVRDALAATFAA
ncbi:MAG: NAD(P)H-binding protein [Nannocystaceae bacterium]